MPEPDRDLGMGEKRDCGELTRPPPGTYALRPGGDWVGLNLRDPKVCLLELGDKRDIAASSSVATIMLNLWSVWISFGASYWYNVSITFVYHKWNARRGNI